MDPTAVATPGGPALFLDAALWLLDVDAAAPLALSNAAGRLPLTTRSVGQAAALSFGPPGEHVPHLGFARAAAELAPETEYALLHGERELARLVTGVSSTPTPRPTELAASHQPFEGFELGFPPHLSDRPLYVRAVLDAPAALVVAGAGGVRACARIATTPGEVILWTGVHPLESPSHVTLTAYDLAGRAALEARVPITGQPG